MITGKTIALTRRTFVGKVTSLLFDMLFLKKDLHDPDNHNGPQAYPYVDPTQPKL